MNLTQYNLIYLWIKQNGSILPAKMAGVIYMGGMFGSETSKRCRELRKMGRLESKKEGRFERFYLKPVILDTRSEIEKQRDFIINNNL